MRSGKITRRKKMMRQSRYRGYLRGDIYTRWLEGDGHRDMEITQHAEYVDERGSHWWIVPGDVVNGAGRKWVSRSLGWLACCVLPKYVGRYRVASVFHDVYCQNKERPSWEVHRMFYELMRYKGVGPIQAFVMWLFVRVFGPRFKGTKQWFRLRSLRW